MIILTLSTSSLFNILNTAESVYAQHIRTSSRDDALSSQTTVTRVFSFWGTIHRTVPIQSNFTTRVTNILF